MVWLTGACRQTAPRQARYPSRLLPFRERRGSPASTSPPSRVASHPSTIGEPYATYPTFGIVIQGIFGFIEVEGAANVPSACRWCFTARPWPRLKRKDLRWNSVRAAGSVGIFVTTFSEVIFLPPNDHYPPFRHHAFSEPIGPLARRMGYGA